MITNVFPVEELRFLAVRKKRPNEFKSLPKSGRSEAEAEGWEVHREGKNIVRMVRPKRKDVFLEDRVWSLLYKMGFSHLSGDRGAQLMLDPKNPESPANQIDVVGLDPEVAIAVECKSSSEPRKSTQFQKDIAKHALIKERFANTVHKQFEISHKRVPVLIMFTWDLILTDNDTERAKQAKVILFNEHDLDYYEQLVAHLGPAAKYQFFSDMLPGRRIHGLEIKIPALKAKMGIYPCYTFSISPEYLLKIAYVSHRKKGKATDVNTYQRMIRKTRLKNIRTYITENGIFPTNIVINFEGKKHVRFEPRQQDGAPEGAKYGTLHLTPAYRSAWIIDGQHRLFAYSGHERSTTSFLNVLAFEGIPPSDQAQLFIDINHEQKSVKRSLLHELYAELNWDAEDEAKRVGAIVSKAIQALNEEKDSPLYGRILLSDDTRTPLRCISLESLFKSINQPGMFIIKKNVEYGPLWVGDNDKTLRRTIYVIKEWINLIRAGAYDWWELGAAEGGGLAMNDGVTIGIGVLRSVFQHLSNRQINLIQLTNSELVDVIKPFGEVLGEYLGNFSAEERLTFRAGSRGIQGQTAGRRQCEKALHDRFPEFEPLGLKEDLELQAAKTNEQAYSVIQRIEKTLKGIIIDTLKAEYGEDDRKLWFYNGVPQKVRLKVIERQDEELGAGQLEDYFTLMDFRTVVLNNYPLFQEVLAYGQKGNKEKRTEWIVKLNDMRKIVMHPAKGRVINWDQLALLEDYETWLESKLEGHDD